ncbi:MAG: hypothetical protein KIS79_11975 [Burkholderiales bacterium]|nr:hypothetical protein [Burkholderiales bacterium]MCW5621817.1 hypothetical protein [Burkholderiales bacterium]
MHKTSRTHGRHPAATESGRRGTTAATQDASPSATSAIAQRIRTLRAEARAVYAEMSAALLIQKQEKK